MRSQRFHKKPFAFSYLLSLLVLIVLAGCALVGRPTISHEHPDAPFPEHPLYIIPASEPSLAIVDADSRQLVDIWHTARLRAASAIVLDSHGYPFITMDIDTNTDRDYREIWVLEPPSGRFLASIPLPHWAPVTLGISDQDILVVGHSLQKPNGYYEIDIVSGPERRHLKTIDVPGLPIDIITNHNLAYIAINATVEGLASGVLVYDTQRLEQKAFYPFPQPANEAPRPPTWLALRDDHSLYAVLFQAKNDSPCQQHGYLATLDLRNGEVTILMELDDVGPIWTYDDHTVLLGEDCPWGANHLSLIDTNQRRIIRQTQLPTLWQTIVITPISDHEVAIGGARFDEDPKTPNLLFFDVAQWQTVAQITLPFTTDVQDMAYRIPSGK